MYNDITPAPFYYQEDRTQGNIFYGGYDWGIKIFDYFLTMLSLRRVSSSDLLNTAGEEGGGNGNIESSKKIRCFVEFKDLPSPASLKTQNRNPKVG